MLINTYFIFINNIKIPSGNMRYQKKYNIKDDEIIGTCKSHFLGLELNKYTHYYAKQQLITVGYYLKYTTCL